jgi:hypothetical protein
MLVGAGEGPERGDWLWHQVSGGAGSGAPPFRRDAIRSVPPTKPPTREAWAVRDAFLAMVIVRGTVRRGCVQRVRA